MEINHDIVLEIEKETKCPILEMFYTKDDNKWYVCFEEYTVINGVNQIVHLDDVLEKIKKYNNIENIMNETYVDDEQENTYFEQITFEWEEKQDRKRVLRDLCDLYYAEGLHGGRWETEELMDYTAEEYLKTMKSFAEEYNVEYDPNLEHYVEDDVHEAECYTMDNMGSCIFDRVRDKLVNILING